MARLIACDLCKQIIPNENSLYSLTCKIETAVYNKGKKPAFNYDICHSCAERLYNELDYARRWLNYER
jgi:hypothetical protein